MVKVKKDLTGMEFGKLTVIEQSEDHICPNGTKFAVWKCLCDCQKDKDDPKYSYVYNTKLLNGKTKSCGCQRAETYVKKNREKIHNEYKLCDNYYIGYTDNGEEFFFDLDKFDLVKHYHWFINDIGYVYTIINSRKILMHRLICGLIPDDDICIDHILGKETRNDNRSYNLRMCTRSQNQMNRNIQANNTSGIKGVWQTPSGNWCAEIMKDYKKYSLGTYQTKEEAEKVRKIAEAILHGDYSYDRSQIIGHERLKLFEQICERNQEKTIAS